MIHSDEIQTIDAIASHYNDLDQYYRRIWGEHLHHGYWRYGNETISQATTALLQLVVSLGNIQEGTRVLDIGCGYGATAKYLAHTIGGIVTALTISKIQWEYARAHDPESNNPRYILGDFLHNKFKDGSYDAVIAIESSEHMENKPLFFSEIARLLKPGGRFVTCVWLTKENPTKKEIQYVLEPICREGRIPSMGSQSEYLFMIENAGFEAIEFLDITQQVKKTWSICIRKAIQTFFRDKKMRDYLLSKNSKERVFAKTLFRIWAAYQLKIMRYGVFSASRH